MIQPLHKAQAIGYHGRLLFEATNMQRRLPEIVHMGKNGHPFHCKIGKFKVRKSQFPAEAQDAIQVQFTYDKTYMQTQQSNLFTIVLQ